MDPFWYRDFFQGIAVDFWQDAATAEWTTADVDLAWRELGLASGIRVLDCPCGHGRHSVELARRGCRVTGIDVSGDCLGRARRAAAEAAVEIDLRQGDMLDLSGLPACDAALTLGNSFGYLDHDGTSRFVQSVAAALRPGGRWLINSGAVAESLLPVLQPEMDYQVADIRIHSRHQYLAERSCLETTYEFTRNGQTETRRNWHFVFTVAEIRRMLEPAELAAVALYGTAAGEPYSLGSRSLYLVAEKRSAL